MMIKEFEGANEGVENTNINLPHEVSQQMLKQGINPADVKGIVCSACGHKFFTEGLMLNKVSALSASNPTGKVLLIPIPVFLCLKCDAPLDVNKQ